MYVIITFFINASEQVYLWVTFDYITLRSISNKVHYYNNEMAES